MRTILTLASCLDRMQPLEVPSSTTYVTNPRYCLEQEPVHLRSRQRRGEILLGVPLPDVIHAAIKVRDSPRLDILLREGFSRNALGDGRCPQLCKLLGSFIGQG